MAVIKKNPSHLDIVVQSAEDVTAFGGAVVADAIARDSGLWELLAAAAPDMEHRQDTSRGIRPDALAAQLLTSFVTGGISVADAGRLAKDAALGKLIGLPKMADETTLCKWLNAQTAESVARMWEINRQFLGWVFKQLPQEQLRDKNGKMSVFFDDTEVELDGHYFENSAVNYNGDTAYSFQTVWLCGRWLASGKLDKGSEDCSKHLRPLLLESKELWHPHAEHGNAHFYADSGSSAGKYLNVAAQYNWSWTISYNKWTNVLDKHAEADKQWGEAHKAIARGSKDVIEEHTWLRHQPGEDCLTGHDFATVRYRPAEGGDLFYRYAYVVCGQANKAPAPVTKPGEAKAVFEIHRQKGAFENCFSNLLGDLDLHHPPCFREAANAMWFALGALANNLLRAMQALAMPEEEQNARLRSIIRYWVTTPVKVTAHAGRRSARVYVPAGLKRFWADLLAKVWAKRQRGGQPRNGPTGQGQHWKVKAKPSKAGPQKAA